MSLLQKHLALKIHSYDKWIPMNITILTLLHCNYEEEFSMLGIGVHKYTQFASTVEYSIVHHPQYMYVFENKLFRRDGLSLCVIPDIERVHTTDYTILEPRFVYDTDVYAVVPCDVFVSLPDNVLYSILSDFRVKK